MMEILAHEIAFDFDGVVADTFRLFVQMAKRDYDVDIDYESIKEYDFLRIIKMDQDHVAQLFSTLTYYPHELDLEPNAGAADVLTRIAETAPPISVVTARPISGPVERWFEKNIPRIRPDSIRISATSESTAKLEILKQHGTRFFVEDRLDTCHLIAAQGITPIVFDQPWNREAHPYTVVKCWDEIDSLITWNGR
jgi:hypothetical protein